MAGIGFELKKLYSEENSSIESIKAIAFSSLVSVGPWIITILTILTLDFITKKYMYNLSERNYFMVTLTYAFIFSQIFSGPWQHFINRFISDCIYEKNYAELKPSYIGIIKIVTVISFSSGLVFMKNSTLPSSYNYAAVLLFTILTATWITMAYVGTIKNYVYIAWAYFVGNLISIVLSIIFLNYPLLKEFKIFPPHAVLMGYLIGIGVTFFMLSSYLLAVFKDNNYADFDFIKHIKKYFSLSLIGIFYVIGFWGHVFLQWWIGDSYTVANVFKVSPFYVNNLFYACFLTMPTIVYFYVFMETNFYLLYKNYYDLINYHGTFKEVEEARILMATELKREITYCVKRQFLITLSFVLAGEYIFNFLGITVYLLDVFKILAFGAFCSIFVSIYIIILLYFDFKNAVLKIATLLALSTIILEGGAIYLGSDYSGYGYFLGSFVTFVYAEYLLDKHMDILNYETFYQQNFIEKAIPSYLIGIKNMLNKKIYLLILMVTMILFTGCSNYDERGFNKKTGRNWHTMSRYDNEGLDINRLNSQGTGVDGFNLEGWNVFTNSPYDYYDFDSKGINKYTQTDVDERGFNNKGVNKETNSDYDKYGFNRMGIHKDTGTEYDKDGWTYYGLNKKTSDYYDEKGLDREGIDREGFDRTGYNIYTKTKYDGFGFDIKGIHNVTKTKYDERGFDSKGIHSITKTKYDTKGFDKAGIHKETGTEFDKNGWTYYGLNKKTNDYIDEKGVTEEGISREGFNKAGYNIYTNSMHDGYGFDVKGIHKVTKTHYDERGFNSVGINKETGTVYDTKGFDRAGINKETGTEYNKKGWTYYGLNQKTQKYFDENGFDENGKYVGVGE